MRAFAFTVLVLFAGCLGSTAPGDDAIDPAASPPDAALMAHLEALAAFPEVVFHTSSGDIRMIFYTDWLPTTTGHIIGLVDAGWYDGTTIHRIVDDFVIQGGDKTGTGEGGSGPFGTSNNIPLEIKEGLQFGSGAVGLARWTDDTGDSQWFITEKPALHLNDPQGTTGDVFGAYSLFAQVFDGMEVVRKIAAVETIPQADRPVENVFLHIAERLPPPADADLVNLVPHVIQPFDAWLGRGATLEVPQFAVAGHPIKIRLIVPAVEDAAGNKTPCQAAEATGNHFGRLGGEPSPEVLFTPTADPCTFEAALVADGPGNWTFSGHDAPSPDATATWTIDVLPWHDAYRPYAGALA